MINYSTYLLANPIDKNAEPKAYAKPQISELMTFKKFVKHIADHNGAFSFGTVQGVLTDMCECLVEQLLSGKKVQLGELGDFWISLSSDGTDSMEEFTSSRITAINILFTPGDSMENLIDRAEFNQVASRVAQAATLKAEKAGMGTVDLAEAKKKKDSSASSSTTPSGDGSASGGSTSGSDSTSGGSSTDGGTGGDDLDSGVA